MTSPGRISRVRRVGLSLACLLLSFAAMPPNTVEAQESELEHDARLEGYADPVALEEGNQALLWLTFGFVSAVALLGMFKDAKRSHLD